MKACEGEKDRVVQLIHKHVGVRDLFDGAQELTGVEEAAEAIMAAPPAQGLTRKQLVDALDSPTVFDIADTIRNPKSGKSLSALWADILWPRLCAVADQAERSEPNATPAGAVVATRSGAAAGETVSSSCADECADQGDWKECAERMRAALEAAQNAFNAIAPMVSIAGLGELTETQQQTFKTRSAVFNVARQTVKEAITFRAVASQSPAGKADHE